MKASELLTPLPTEHCRGVAKSGSTLCNWTFLPPLNTHHTPHLTHGVCSADFACRWAIIPPQPGTIVDLAVDYSMLLVSTSTRLL